MDKSRERVGGYRGRRTLTDVLKVVAVILGVFVLLLLIVFGFGQRFIVYSDDGLRLELPFWQQEPELPELDPDGIHMIERPGVPGDASEDGTQPGHSNVVLSAVMLNLGDIQAGTVTDRLEAAGANAVILEMKDNQGQLYWASQQELALSTHVNGPESTNQMLKQWLQGDVYTIAKVCCFRDNTIPYQRNPLALRATYGNWRDELGLRWMNPASADTQFYLYTLCRELAELGFDEILLECYAFPEQGNQEPITTQVPQGRTKIAEEFLSQVRQEIREYGTKLSVLVEPGVLDGTETVSGVTGQLLKEQADRLWVEETEYTLGQALLGEEKQERLVCIRTTLEKDPAGPQALLNE